MEIRDPLHGTIQLLPSETQIIESREFQRLRAIKQLGFAEFSFPGATHNRFLHSIGVCHLAGLIFDQIFREHSFSSATQKQKFRSLVRLGALLHDIGHGPLSHTTEEVMPLVAELKIEAYKSRKAPKAQLGLNSHPPAAPSLGGSHTDGPQTEIDLNDVRATHEDYTIKYLTDSPLTSVIEKNFPELRPYDVACLIDCFLEEKDQFFHDQGIDFRPVLSQIVSSELDADRMDYLERDSLYCGTNYGKFDAHWLVNNLGFQIKDDRAFLALNRRALYTFDDFLISRHHMHLMVYFHHKSIIYEELLTRYLTSSDCDFKLPAEINEYTRFNDYKLFEHLSLAKNSWAQRIAERKPYKVLIELHSTEDSLRPQYIERALEKHKIDSIWASSKTRLSKYHNSDTAQLVGPIYVRDQYDPLDRPTPIDLATEVFTKYEEIRIIDRIYVPPEQLAKAQELLRREKL